MRFTPRDAGLVFRALQADHAYITAVSTAKLEDVIFHALRHTFASWATMRGATLKELQELLGHGPLP